MLKGEESMIGHASHLKYCPAGSSNGNCLNVITNNVNNNVVDAIINDSITDQCIFDTGSYLSLFDNNFVKLHNLCVTPLKSGALRTYTAAGENKITAIGTTNVNL